MSVEHPSNVSTQQASPRSVVEADLGLSPKAAWFWLAIIPAIIVLAGIAFGLVLASIHKPRATHEDTPEGRQEAHVAASTGEGSEEGAARVQGSPVEPALPAVPPTLPVESQKPVPTRSPTMELLVGRWTGATESDGVLTLSISASGRLAYNFSAGCREHNQGRIRLSENTLYYMEDGDRRPVAWWCGLDSSGRLHLRMEDSEEVFLLRREK